MGFIDWLFKRAPIKYVHRATTKCVVAPTGTGKSTLQACLANDWNNNQLIRAYAEQKVRELNEGGFKGLRLPSTLSYSDTTIKLIGGGTTNHIDGYKFQTPNEIEESVFLPPGADVHFDEPYKYWGNRESSSFPERTESEFRIHRHNDINLTLYYQEKNGVDKKIRECLHEYWVVQYMQVNYCFRKADEEGYRKIKSVDWVYYKYTDYDNFIKGVVPITRLERIKMLWRMYYNPSMWFPFIYFNYAAKMQLRKEYEELLQSTECVEYCTYTFHGDPFKLFNSKFFAPVQYRYMGDPKDYRQWAQSLKFDSTPNLKIRPNIADYYKFNKLYTVERPETYTKMSTARRIKKRQDKEKQKE